jgi:cytochrome P450
VVEVAGLGFRQSQRRLRKNAIDFLGRCAALGDVVKLQLARPTYLLSNPRDIHHVFVDQPGRYVRNGLQTAFRPLFGQGLFSRTGRSHIESRRLIQPLLHRGRLEGFVPPLVSVLGEILPSWKPGQVIEAGSTIMDLTMRGAGRMILGLQRAEDAAELFAAIHGSHQRVVRNMQSLIRLPNWLPTKRNRTLNLHVGRLDAVVQRLIAEARASDRNDSLLTQLVRIRDGAGAGLDDRQIRDHALTVFLAAYDPPATAIAWILHLLARHPETQRTLQAEIDAHQSKADAVAQRPVMATVIAEALRLYPSTWLLTRRAAERDALPSGASIPRGADVFASPLLVQRDPRHYERPLEFRPERFLGGTAAGRAAGTYFPFGLGPTACLGEYLAKLMIATTVEAIVGRFKLATCDNGTPQAQSFNLFTMSADRPINLRLMERDVVSDLPRNSSTSKLAGNEQLTEVLMTFSNGLTAA